MQKSRQETKTRDKHPQTRAILIANPLAGSYIQRAHQLEDTVTYLRQQHWQATLQYTHEAGDARRLAREAVEQGIDVVVAVGGDGTINEIIQELAGSETALGVIPGGTVNVWAREVGIPQEIAATRAILVNGQTRRIDLGRVNDRYFLLMMGIGMDGEITYAVEKKPAKRLGVLGYLLIGTWHVLGYPAFRTTLEIDDRIIKTTALQIVIGNTQLYAGAIRYTWQAKCDDGLLDICIVRKQSMAGRLVTALNLLLHRKQQRQHVQYETGQSIKIHTRYPVAIQIDGDPLGHTERSQTPTQITVEPGSLKVIVPHHTPEDLFTTDLGIDG
jgi:YegS/Rv2252/BmrU family lipid kinase